MLTLVVLLLSSSTVAWAASEGNQVLTASKWREIRGDVIAVGVELYDDDGNMQEFSWIDGQELVASFVEAMPADGVEDAFVLRIPAQPVYVHTSAGEVYRFDIIGVDQGQPGVAVLDGAVIPLQAGLDRTIAQGYGLDEFSSSDNVFRKWMAQVGTEGIPDEDPSIPVSSVSRSRGGLSPIDVLVYAPDEIGGVNVKKWAESVAAQRKTTVAVLAKHPSLFIKGASKLPASGFCIRTLSLAVHGSPGLLIFGKRTGPFDTFIGATSGQTDPVKFGSDLSGLMCPGGSIRVLACFAAAASAGKQLLKDLADGAGVPVYGYDDFIFFGFNVRDPSVPMASTRGAQWRSTPPGGTAVGVEPRSVQRVIEPVPH